MHRNNKEKPPTISQRFREYRFAREYRSGVSFDMFFTSLLITSFIKGCFLIRTFIKGWKKVIFWIVKFYTNHLYVQAFKVKHWKRWNIKSKKKLPRNFSCSEKFKKNPKKRSMVVYFELILAIKTPLRTTAVEIIWESGRDDFLCYRCSRSKLLEYSYFEKNSQWCTSSILGNKVLYDDSFLVIFLKYFRTGILNNNSGQMLLKGFSFYGRTRPKMLKRLLWKMWENHQHNVRRSIKFFNFYLIKLLHHGSFPRNLWNVSNNYILKNTSERLLLRLLAKAALS